VTLAQTPSAATSESGSAQADPALTFEGVWYTYPGAPSPAIQGIRLHIEQGERLGILGPNGGGKSTLLRLALGLIEPDAGRVRVLGLEPSRARRAGLIGTVPQRIQPELSFPLSVREVASMPAARRIAPWRNLPSDARKRVEQALELVGASEYASRPIGTLSGGQLQRVMIARALAASPRILLLDEPTVGIDVAGQRRFAELLHRVHTALSLTIVIVSHDVRAIATGCDRVACLHRHLHSHTSPAGLTPQVLAEVFQHDLADVFGEVHVEAHRAEECPDPEHRHAHSSPGRSSQEPDSAHD